MLTRSRAAFLIAAALVCCSTGCIQWPDNAVRSDKPDKVLFDRAIAAAERHRYDVANLTLQTLLNTYPDSKYAHKAQGLLEDPHIACAITEGTTWVVGSFVSPCPSTPAPNVPTKAFAPESDPD